jgi:hypothetical protein
MGTPRGDPVRMADKGRERRRSEPGVAMTGCVVTVRVLPRHCSVRGLSPLVSGRAVEEAPAAIENQPKP